MGGRKSASKAFGILGLCAMQLVEIAIAQAQSVPGSPRSFRFQKDASQYCLASLTAERQSEIFSRIMNLGASYSHGCAQCDAAAVFRNQLIATQDEHFVRRNYLAQFLSRAPWKSPNEFQFEFLSVLENDATSNLAEMFSKQDLGTKGYDGKWAFFPDKMQAELLSPELDKYALTSPGFKDESALVGNGFVRRDLSRRDLSRRGHIYQSVPGHFAESGAKQKNLFDLAADKTRTFELMKFYGDADLYKKLAESGWNNEQDRATLISKTVRYLRSFAPSTVFSPDSLFWDAVPALFARAREQNPNSLITKLITLPVFSKLIDLDYFGREQRERMVRDYYTVLSKLSRNNGQNKSIPIFLGRLIDSPGEMIRSKGLEKEFGALIGSFVEVFTGRDFTKQITEQLKEKALVANQSKFRSFLTFGASPSSHVEPIPTDQFSKLDLQKINNALEEADKISRQYLKQESAQMFALPPGTEPMLPWLVRGAINAAILNALGDTPLLLEAADWAFADQNRIAREVTADPRNNIHLLNVDAFYQNFHLIVNQYTMHPSIKGAGIMADLVEESLCNSQGPNP